MIELKRPRPDGAQRPSQRVVFEHDPAVLLPLLARGERPRAVPRRCHVAIGFWAPTESTGVSRPQARRRGAPQDRRAKAESAPPPRAGPRPAARCRCGRPSRCRPPPAPCPARLSSARMSGGDEDGARPQPSTSNSVGIGRTRQRRQIVERELVGARDVPGGGDGRRHQHGRTPVAFADQEMAGTVAADELDLRRVGRRQGLVERPPCRRRDHALAFSAFSSLVLSCSGRRFR